jgi:hypothetical protein
VGGVFPPTPFYFERIDMDSFLARGTGASNGFWGNVVGGIGEGLGKVASEMLPVWAASQMGLENQGPVTGIDNPLANSSMGDLGGIPTNTSGINPYAQQWGDGTFNIESPQPNTVLAAGVVLVGLIILFKVM